MNKQERAQHILERLEQLFPAKSAQIALQYSNEWELLVAVMLSAQCTDNMVNKVTLKLFRKYSTIQDIASTEQKELEQIIHSTGFYKNKAKHIIATAKQIIKNHNGNVPQTMEELTTLPGVARKTANVVLSNAFGIHEGIAVDTHVKRFAQKFELTTYKDPNKIEQDLMKLYPKKEWNTITYKFIEYGRQYCPARRHNCTDHPLTKLYPKAANIWPTSK